jgi:hypothetical protein
MVNGGNKIMNTQTLTPSQLRKAGVEALAKALGPIGMVRFLQFFETGAGDYTKEREKWLDKPGVRNIVEEIKEKWKKV